MSGLTEELCEQAASILDSRGFVDKQAWNSWNMFQMEREFGDHGTLIVWGRRSLRGLMLEWGQEPDQTITIVDTEDLE